MGRWWAGIAFAAALAAGACGETGGPGRGGGIEPSKSTLTVELESQVEDEVQKLWDAVRDPAKRPAEGPERDVQERMGKRQPALRMVADGGQAGEAFDGRVRVVRPEAAAETVECDGETLTVQALVDLENADRGQAYLCITARVPGATAAMVGAASGRNRFAAARPGHWLWDRTPSGGGEWRQKP